ncbi:MAG: ankyrin repeat domain-containing protein [Bacteroidetes bacterium]|nr:ankyrin repeat domain-containing protein [Bacteroidota bacterium]
MLKYFLIFLYSTLISFCSFSDRINRMKVKNLKLKLNNKYKFINDFFKSINKDDDDDLTFLDFNNDIKLKLLEKINLKQNIEYKNFFSELTKLLFNEHIKSHPHIAGQKIWCDGVDKNGKLLLSAYRITKDIKVQKNQNIKKKRIHNNRKKKKIKSSKKKKNQKDKLNNLSTAINNDDTKQIKKLLKSKVNPNNKLNEQEYPLLLAIKKNKEKFFKLLLKFKANPKLRDNQDNDAILNAVIFDRYNIVELLLKHDVNLINSKKRATLKNSLHLAALFGHKEIIKILVKYIIKYYNLDFFNYQDIDGNTALNLACLNDNNIEVCELLSKNKATINIPNFNNITPLHNAALNENIKLIKFLILNNAEINAIDNMGDTPLHKCINSKETVKILIENGANPFIENKTKQMPLNLINDDNNTEICKLIFELKTDKGNTLIHSLTNNNHETFEYIFSLSPEIDILIENEANQNPIDIALENFKIKSLFKFIKYISSKKNKHFKTAIYDLDKFYKEVKENDIKEKNQIAQNNIVEFIKQKEVSENKNIQGLNEFESIYLELKIVNELLDFLENTLIIINLNKEEEGSNIFSKIKVSINILSIINGKIIPIITKINTANDFCFLTNKYCNQNKYLEVLKIISRYWYIKAGVTKNINKNLKKRALREYQKSIDMLIEAKKYNKKYKIENPNLLEFIKMQIILKQLEFKKITKFTDKENEILKNKYNIHKIAKKIQSKWIEELEIKKNDLMEKDLEKLSLINRLNKLNSDKNIFKNYYSVYSKAISLFQSQKLDKIKYAEYLNNFNKIANSEFFLILNKIKKQIDNDKSNYKLDLDLKKYFSSIFTTLFNIHFRLSNFKKCEMLCDELEMLEDIFNRT